MKGTLFIISAPSGAGKTTLINKILENFKDLVFSISYTTRPPRRNEKNNVDYFFVSEKKFQNMIDENDFLEYAKVHDHYYGTGKNFVIKNLDKGSNVILDIDFQGAKIVKKSMQNLEYDIVTIFILPPSYDELKKRLENRGTDKKEVIETRLKNALIEMENSLFYDYIIINENLDHAYNDLCSIFRTNRLKKDSMKRKVIDIIDDYKKKLINL